MKLDLNSRHILYADDAVFYISGSDLLDINRRLQEDLVAIGKWMKFNKLTVNVAKSKFMLVGSKSMLKKVKNFDLRLTIDNVCLESVTKYDYLGVAIDQTLSFEYTANVTYARACNKLYLLSLLRKYLSYSSALRIMKSMVMPYLEYVFFVLNACTDRLITRLQRLQNRGLRICQRANLRTSVADLHLKSKCLLVKNKIRMNTLKQMHRIIYKPNCR